jgi:uncharacterized membrane protein (TIGR02234 family)
MLHSPSGRREFVALLLAGAAGAGLVLLATRQQVARVEVIAPHPLPATVTALNGQSLLPAASALAVAALASLAAVVATRGLLRRATGLITCGLGIVTGVCAASGFSVAQVLTAAGHANLSPASGAGGGVSPGSTTSGSGSGQAAGSLAGFPAHVIFAGSAWRVLMLTGAVLVVLAGVSVVAIANRLPAMSGRYERASGVAAGRAAPPPTGRAERTLAASAARAGRGEAAAMWDTLNAGADPTVELALGGTPPTGGSASPGTPRTRWARSPDGPEPPAGLN